MRVVFEEVVAGVVAGDALDARVADARDAQGVGELGQAADACAGSADRAWIMSLHWASTICCITDTLESRFPVLTADVGLGIDPTSSALDVRTRECVRLSAGSRPRHGMPDTFKSDSDVNAVKGPNRGLQRQLAATLEWVQVAMAPPGPLDLMEQRE